MSTFLVGGVGPRPSKNAKKVYATGLRLQTLAEAVKNNGHDVHIVEAAFGGEKVDTSEKKEDQFPVTKLTGDLQKDIKKFSRLAKKLQKNKDLQGVITTTDYVGHVAALGSGKLPLWCDFFGHPMAERQMQAYVGNNSVGLEDQWRMILPILLKADRFSVCSNSQRLALTGELGAAGRLSHHTCMEELVEILLPPNPFKTAFRRRKNNLLRGEVVPDDARIILFTGGYNTWLDEETLFEGVEKALSQNKNFHYVSTGGEIQGHVTEVFKNFKTRIENSKYKSRFHFLGWVNHDDFVQCCLESDVGVMIDQPTLEGELGCRNRLFSWLWAGMRIVTSDLSEPTREQFLPDQWIDPVPMKDAQTLSTALVRNLKKGRLSDKEVTARNRIARKKLSINTCFKSLQDWINDPQKSSDNLSSMKDWNSLRRHHWDYVVNGLDSDYRELFERLQGSRLFGLYKNISPDTQSLIERIIKKRRR